MKKYDINRIYEKLITQPVKRKMSVFYVCKIETNKNSFCASASTKGISEDKFTA